MQNSHFNSEKTIFGYQIYVGCLDNIWPSQKIHTYIMKKIKKTRENLKECKLSFLFLKREHANKIEKCFTCLLSYPEKEN